MCTLKAKIVWTVLAACCAASTLSLAQVPAQSPSPSAKAWKDKAEYDLYQALNRDMETSAFAKAIPEIEAWREKYPDSDFKNERELLLVKAYLGAGQPAKALDSAAELLEKDYNTVLSGPSDAANLLFLASSAIQQIPDPTPRQLATGEKAARALAAYDKMPAGEKPEEWAKDRARMAATAQSALLYIALAPGIAELKKPDCSGAPAAESALRRALEDHPQSAQAAALFGQAELCIYRTVPERISTVLYEYARAAGLDPAKAAVDANWQKQMEKRLEDLFRQYHGDDLPALKQLQAAALTAPFPPEGFAVKSKAQIEEEARVDFEKNHPELALWRNIKAQLTGADGAQYFESNMKDAMLPPLLGTLVEAKPACRPTELLVAISAADGPAEALLKLDKPLTGMPELHTQLRWEGVAKVFSREPFTLTMETETARIEGLKTSPCAAPATKRIPAK